MLTKAFRVPSLGGRQTDRRALLAAIHANAKTLGMSDEDRRAFQLRLTGQASCQDMPLAELQLVDRELRRLLTVVPSGKKPYFLQPASRVTRHGSRSGRDERLPAEPITKEQLDRIDHLRQHVQYHASAAWQAFCRRTCGHPWPQTRAEANKIIEALKSMDARGWRARGI